MTAVLAIVTAALTVSACAVSLDVTELERDELLEIHSAFEAIVEEAHADPDIRWESGWIGNISVNESTEGAHRGLCYEWQELVFARIAPAVERVGWEAVRININVGHFNEHHAVLVWDPADVTRDDILDADDPPAWVLDAWNSGEAEIFPLRGWIDGQALVFTPAAFELP